MIFLICRREPQGGGGSYTRIQGNNGGSYGTAKISDIRELNELEA